MFFSYEFPGDLWFWVYFSALPNVFIQEFALAHCCDKKGLKDYEDITLAGRSCVSQTQLARKILVMFAIRKVF